MWQLTQTLLKDLSVPVGLEDVEKPCVFSQTDLETLNTCRPFRVLQASQGLGSVISWSAACWLWTSSVYCEVGNIVDLHNIYLDN